MKKVLIITGDAKKVEGFAHEQRFRFRRDKMTAELKTEDETLGNGSKTEEPEKTVSETDGNGGKNLGNGDGKDAPKEDVKDAPKEDTKDAPKEETKEVKKEDKKSPKTDKK